MNDDAFVPQVHLPEDAAREALRQAAVAVATAQRRAHPCEMSEAFAGLARACRALRIFDSAEAYFE